MILVGLQNAHHLSTVGIMDMMIQKFTFRDNSLVSPSVTSPVQFSLSE